MQFVSRLILVLVLACAGSTPPTAGANQARPAAEQPPNIILITLDTTRADRMGFLGSRRGLTPNLDALAARSVVFTRAYAQVPMTSPSHAALLTGTYPQFNHLRDLAEPLAEDLPYLPEILHQHGYRTAAVIGAMVLDPNSGAAPGFDRGFDVYDSDFHNPAPGEDRYQSLERRAEDVANRGMNWLSHRPEGPFFLWLHFFDPHDPYDPPEPFKTRHASQPYDGEIAYTDSIVGSVIEVLERHGLFEKTLIAVAADHGEAFGEHGEKRHGLLLYDETIHVPLLLKLPNEKFAGRRVDARVGLADVAPSLLEGAGVSIPAAMQAQSLLPLIAALEAPAAHAVRDAKSSERAVYSETDYAHRTFGWSELHSWRSGKYLYIRGPGKELYDESSDPHAQKNLALTSRAVAGTLDGQLSEFRQKTTSNRAEQRTLDATQAESLHALGYLASDSGSSSGSSQALVDPKNKTRLVNQVQEALFELEQGHYETAMTALRQVVRDPAAVNAYLEFGMAMARHQRYQDALPLLQAAAQKMPKSEVAHYELAKVLVNTSQWQAALTEMEAASALKPDSAQLHFYVASLQGRLKHIPDAISQYEEALKLAPDHFDANLSYGRLLLQLGHPDQALPKLSRAVQIKPESPVAHGSLAEAYQQLGQIEDASRERMKAEELKRSN